MLEQNKKILKNARQQIAPSDRINEIVVKVTNLM